MNRARPQVLRSFVLDPSGPLENLALVVTHPVQYQVPWYQALSAREDLRFLVYFMFLPDAQQQGEGFDQSFSWDVPILEGYSWSLLRTRSANRNTAQFSGLRVNGVAESLARDNIGSCIIHGWGSYGLLQALFACKKLGIKTLVRGEANSFRSRPFWKKLGHRFLLRQYDAYLGIGRANVDFYADHGIDAERIFWCPYGVDNDSFHRNTRALKEQRASIRQRWEIGDDETCFLFVGKFQEKKRLPDLIQALHLVRKHNHKLRLLAVGAGKEESSIRELSNQLSVPITFTGFLNQSRIAEAYVAADCLVLPSDHDETWGLVVNEAMACGIPAIVSDRVGCGPDLIVSNDTGVVFRFGDIADLSKAILMMAADESGRLSMGERAHAHVQSYGVHQATDGVVRALRYLRSV